MALGAILSWPTLAAAGGGFLLGCRHGLDWDHIAAITDLSAAGGGATSESPRRHRHRHRGSLSLAVWYCLGHGLVIALLGAAVGILGLNFPSGIDRVFESIVGMTLIALGGFVLYQLGRDRRGYRYAGRWRVAVGAVRRAWARARRRGAGPAEPLDDLGRGAAFAVGVLHGTGAETPTQVVLFASAGAAGSSAAAATILLAFVAGLIVSDVGIAATWLSGLLAARRRPALHIGLGALTGTTSLIIGSLFLAGHSAVLPALFGG